MRTAIQLYALRELDRPLPAIVAAAGELGYEGVEFAYRLDDADVDAVREAMNRAGLTAAGAHVPIERFESIEATVSRYGRLDCRTLVVPFLPAARFADRPSVAGAAETLADIADRLADRDVTVGYHNHDHEFVPLDGETAYDVLATATPPSVHLQVDVGLAALAGRDPVGLLECYGDRIRQVHLKDYDLAAGESVDLGDGDVDVAACVEAARAAGVEWAIVEFESSEKPLASAERSLATLEALL